MLLYRSCSNSSKGQLARTVVVVLVSQIASAGDLVQIRNLVREIGGLGSFCPTAALVQIRQLCTCYLHGDGRSYITQGEFPPPKSNCKHGGGG